MRQRQSFDLSAEEFDSSAEELDSTAEELDWQQQSSIGRRTAAWTSWSGSATCRCCARRVRVAGGDLAAVEASDGWCFVWPGAEAGAPPRPALEDMALELIHKLALELELFQLLVDMDWRREQWA
jgi:hypothetical protein